MDYDEGGNSSTRPESAAELARKQVLAAYSSTVESYKNLSDAEKLALENQTNSFSAQPYSSMQGYQHPTPQNNTDNWSTNTPNDDYQRTAIYSQQPTTPIQTPSAPTKNKISQRLNRQHHFFNRKVSKSKHNSPNQPTDNLSDHGIKETPTPTNYTETETLPALNPTQSTGASMLKDIPVDQATINAEWQQYHSAWQDYYKNYYSEYYAKAAQNYLATEKMKNERIASGRTAKTHRFRHFAPLIIVGLIVLTALFLQYNRLLFAPIMAYISPDSGSIATNIEAIDPTINQNVSSEPRLLIPKLNIDVPVEFGIETASIDDAMNRGVAQFSIPGANAMPGQIGNLVISGHSAGDIYSSNPYKFIFSGLERLSPGDLIYINYESVRYTYQMTGSEVVEPTDVQALIYETDKPILTLITCTPLGTSRYRLLITAEQISPSYDTNNIPNPDDTPSNTEDESTTDPAMPANEPSFFENLWHNIFG